MEARPFWSATTAALSSQASSCLRAGHGTDVDNTVESYLPLQMGSQTVVWKADTVKELGGLASMGFRWLSLLTIFISTAGILVMYEGEFSSLSVRIYFCLSIARVDFVVIELGFLLFVEILKMRQERQ